MSPPEVLIAKTEGPLRILSLNRPERRNALNAELMDALVGAVRIAGEDPSVGAILLRAEGPAFCVGGDVKEMATGQGRSLPISERIEVLRQRMEVSRLLHTVNKPTIAALHGAVAGAGLAIALACDFRVMARSTKLTTAFAKVGLSGDFGGSWFLTRLVGPARARDLYLRPRVLDPETLLALGLVTELTDDDRLDEIAHDLARELAHGPRVAQAYIKQNLNRAELGSLEASLDAEAQRHILSAQSADHLEASAAFVEKRPPVFTGR